MNDNENGKSCSVRSIFIEYENFNFIYQSDSKYRQFSYISLKSRFQTILVERIVETIQNSELYGTKF